jgi:hypothetical protein
MSNIKQLHDKYINDNFDSLTAYKPEADQSLKDGEPCSPGCINHVTHPCEKCGRIQGREKKHVLY